MSVRVRFAPSPTGHLHLGNVRTALFNWLFARGCGGAFLLRIEDTDPDRSNPEYEAALREDLLWLGLEWDEGPGSKGRHGPYHQSQRLELYRSRARALVERSRAYHCFCPREVLERERRRQLEGGEVPRYSGRCRALSPGQVARRLAAGEPSVIRLRVRQGEVALEDLVFGNLSSDCRQIGDFILLRSDGRAAYDLACVVDDQAMEISHVIRGEGHISSSYRQLLLYEAFGWSPPRFAHLSTILGPDGSKLSKRQGATSIREFRRRGYLASALLNYLALLGWSPPAAAGEILALEELVRMFHIEGVNRSPATFDPEKLDWINRQHLRRLPPRALAEKLLPYLERQGWLPGRPTEEVMAWLEEVGRLLVGYLGCLEEIIAVSEPIFLFDPARAMEREETRGLLEQPGAREVIQALAAALENQPCLDREECRALLERVKRQSGHKGRLLFHPLRLALTARASGPELDRLLPLLERASRLALPRRLPGLRQRVRAFLELL